MTTQTDTRQRILDVALASFLADGYEQTTIAGIRERSGTSNGALFHHFPSKEAIAGALHVAAIASFQQGLWDLVGRPPASLHDAVRAVLAHQLGWTEQNTDLARFIYARGQLDWDTAAGAELAARNRDLAAAFRQWLVPLADRGEIRPLPMLLVSAIVSGPAHAIAQRWLAGHLSGPLTGFAEELTIAACAALGPGAAPATARPGQPQTAPPAPVTARIHVDLVAGDGTVVARAGAGAPLTSP